MSDIVDYGRPKPYRYGEVRSGASPARLRGEPRNQP